MFYKKVKEEKDLKVGEFYNDQNGFYKYEGKSGQLYKFHEAYFENENSDELIIDEGIIYLTYSEIKHLNIGL